MKDYPTSITAPVSQDKLCMSPAQKKIIQMYITKHDGQQVRLTLSQPMKWRSLNQNAYMCGVVYTMIAAETGHTTEEIHEYMKAMFLPRHFIRIGNKEEQVVKSTTTLSTF